MHTTDTADTWHVVITPGGIQARRGHGQAGTVVSGPAYGLYLLLWNRQDAASARVTVSGDSSSLRLWQDSMQVRWA